MINDTNCIELKLPTEIIMVCIKCAIKINIFSGTLVQGLFIIYKS